ncbi:MAG: chalcone isomerase family protein [Cocleimonas sp.]
MKALNRLLSSCFILSILLTFSLFISTANASTTQWPLHSKGEVRYLRMIKVYDISLYSPSQVTADNILSANISKCLKLDYRVGLTVDKFRLATSKILKRQHTTEFLAKIEEPLNQLQMAYQPVKKGDTYTLCYNGKTQIMQLDINDKKLVEIKSADLAKAYLGIWLSKNQPISGPLFRTFFPNKT